MDESNASPCTRQNRMTTSDDTMHHRPGTMPWRRLHRRLNRFRTSADAATMLEFALLAPLFFALLLEILQLGLYFYVSSTVDYATNVAARKILTGAVGNQNLTATQFRANVLCPLLPASFSGAACSNTVVVNLVNLPAAGAPGGFYSLLNAQKSGLVRPVMDNATTKFCPGFSGGPQSLGPASAEVLQVYYPMPVISLYWAGMMATTLNGSLVYYVGSVAAFQNEPYFSSSQTGGC